MSCYKIFVVKTGRSYVFIIPYILRPSYVCKIWDLNLLCAVDDFWPLIYMTQCCLKSCYNRNKYFLNIKVTVFGLTQSYIIYIAHINLYKLCTSPYSVQMWYNADQISAVLMLVIFCLFEYTHTPTHTHTHTHAHTHTHTHTHRLETFLNI